jgi:hypothetical protein
MQQQGRGHRAAYLFSHTHAHRTDMVLVVAVVVVVPVDQNFRPLSFTHSHTERHCMQHPPLVCISRHGVREEILLLYQ